MPARRQIDRLFFVASFSNITRVQTYKEKFKWGLRGLEWNKKNSLLPLHLSLKFGWNAIIDCDSQSPIMWTHPYVKSRLIKKSWLASTTECKNYLAIKISPSSWHREIATESWACFTKKFHGNHSLAFYFETFRAKNQRLTFYGKTQSNHFWWSSKISWCWFFSHSDPHLKTMLK